MLLCAHSPPLANLDSTRLPAHLAIVMDGNSRWATARGLPTSAGHARGVQALRRLVTDCLSLEPIRVLTVYAFSHENWERPADEVGNILSLIEKTLEAEADTLLRRGVRLRFCGELDALPTGLRALTAKLAARAPPSGERLLLCVALSYSGRQEVARAARELAARGLRIDVDSLSAALQEHGVPSDPDLLVRTGGRSRLSNFLLWQSAYSEIILLERLWPDFGTADLSRALAEFGGQVRTFGRRHSHDAIEMHLEEPEEPEECVGDHLQDPRQ